MLKFVRPIPFAEMLGLQLMRFESGEAEIHVELTPDQCNSFQAAHGGLIMTLLDVVMAHAARSPTPGQSNDDRGVVTIEMKTSFMRPGQGRLVGRARVMHRTGTMAFCEATVHGGEGELVAHASGTFKYMRDLPQRSD
jgi:uncharacterized protein (TIGR00369 family)